MQPVVNGDYISTESKSRHLIECKSLKEYEIAKKALAKFDGLLELSNFDGTYDFVIECTPEYAKLLKDQNLSVIADAILNIRSL
jgi:hypothetical protein